MTLHDRYQGLSAWNRVAFWGSAASIVSLVLAVVTTVVMYLASDDTSRRLVYYANPIKTAVVKRGEASDIQVRYREQNVDGDISIAQSALWNAGIAPIRKEDVLEDVCITLTPSAPILDAKVYQVTRKLTRANIATTRIAVGTVPVSWEILEAHDAILIQVTYSGGADVTLGVDGALLGQPSIPRFDPAFVQTHKTVNQPTVALIFGVVLMCVGVCLIGGTLISLFRTQDGQRLTMLAIVLPIWAVGAVVCYIGVQNVRAVWTLPNVQLWKLPHEAPTDWFD